MQTDDREQPGPSSGASSSMPSRPFGPGSVSIRLYPHNELPADAIVREVCAQARLAFENGFDGVMTSEHHGGFAGYAEERTTQSGTLEIVDGSGVPDLIFASDHERTSPDGAGERPQFGD